MVRSSKSVRCAGVLGVVVFTVLAAGCAPPDRNAPKPFPFRIVVEGDPGHPIGGVKITRDSKELGSTDAQGIAKLALRGADGDVIDVDVKCPDTFRSPVKPLSLRLAKVSSDKTPEVKVACPPTTRRVVVAIRADRGPNLPVRYLDQVVARTDASGAATFAVDVAAGAQFTVALDTTEPGSERLRPQNPSRPFVANGEDALVLMDQKFTLEKKPVVAAKPKPKIICLTCRGT
jgi:hypothetical protein